MDIPGQGRDRSKEGQEQDGGQGQVEGKTEAGRRTETVTGRREDRDRSEEGLGHCGGKTGIGRREDRDRSEGRQGQVGGKTGTGWRKDRTRRRYDRARLDVRQGQGGGKTETGRREDRDGVGTGIRTMKE